MTTYTITKKWLAAFNEHNLEVLLALYDDNAEHFSPKLKLRNPETKGKIKGKDALRSWWKDAFDRIPELTYQENTITPSEDRVFMEYTRLSREKRI